MRKKLRKMLSYLISYSVILSGLLNLRAKYIIQKNYSLALFFHNPDKELFENIILWFKKKGFRFLSLQELLSIIKTKERTMGGVWISFDDGYEENIQNVLPILNKFNIPATFFITTKSVEEGYFWHDLINNLPNNLVIDPKTLWTIENSKRVRLISEIKKEFISFPRRAISIENLKRLASNSLITIGNHTDDHVICINCNRTELNREIMMCREKLINWIGDKYVNVFSYPNGDFNKKVIEVVKKNNIAAAFTTEPKLITDKIDIHSIPRMGIVNNISFPENILHALGMWQPIIKNVNKIL